MSEDPRNTPSRHTLARGTLRRLQRFASRVVGRFTPPFLMAAGAAPPRERCNTSFQFSCPAHVAFEIISPSGPEATERLARALVARLSGLDTPLVSLSGPLATASGIQNLEVWLGSISGGDIALELETSG